MSQSKALCRLCSKEKQPMVPILESNPLNVREKMLKLLKIKVSPSSTLPQQVCLECLAKLNQFNEFYTQIHENQVILQLIFNEKPEPEASTDEKSTSECSTQTDPAKHEEGSQFIIIEEVTNDEESMPLPEIQNGEEDKEEVIMEIEDKSVISIIKKEEGRARRKFDRFDCYLCHLQLPGNSQFIQHFAQQHPNEELKYQCYICNGFVKKYRSFTRHTESHQEKRFSCDICDLKFSQKITLISHLTTHAVIKTFECSDCGLSFKQNSSLFKHRRQKHSKNVPLCKICNRHFVNSETYQQHLRSKHNQGDKNITCEECNKKFASKSAFAYHRLSIHKVDKEIRCGKCSENFKNKITLARHAKKCGK